MGEDDPRRLTLSVRRAIAYQRLLHIVIDSAARA
jgi:hypothetical protein